MREVNAYKMDSGKQGLGNKQLETTESNKDESRSVTLETVKRDSKEALKRQKDSLKKRMLRSNEEYRKKEAEKAKLRIANKRKNNPDFREIERQRDKHRRAQARRNFGIRNIERQRDREYRRLRRAVFETPDQSSET